MIENLEFLEQLGYVYETRDEVFYIKGGGWVYIPETRLDDLVFVLSEIIKYERSYGAEEAKREIRYSLGIK